MGEVVVEPAIAGEDNWSAIMEDDVAEGLDGEPNDNEVGERIAPTAVEREKLLGRTKKALAPGMMRKPYFSPRLSKMWF